MMREMDTNVMYKMPEILGNELNLAPQTNNLCNNAKSKRNPFH